MAPPLLQLARLSAALLSVYSIASASSSTSSTSSMSSTSSWASSGSTQCTRGRTALTSACLGRCYEGRPCVAYAADAGSPPCQPTAFSACVDASGCALECFTNGPDDLVARDAVGFSAYTFLVPFPDSEGERSADEEDDTDALPSKSNAVLTRIEPLSLLDVTTSVSIIGGSSVHGVVARGRAAEMSLADGFLAANTQLQAITLANLALRTLPLGALPTPSVANLTLRNCLLSSTYPPDLSSMAMLARLDASLNQLSDFPSSLRLPALQELNLSSNELESFRGALPALVSLDLSNNQLTSIPASVFALPRLERLYLGGNPFASALLSESQLAFLQRLRVLSTDSLGDVSLCSSPSSADADADAASTAASASARLHLVTVHGVGVCALIAPSPSSQARDGSETSVTAVDASSPTSEIVTIAGSIVGGVVVLLALAAAIAAYVHRRQRRPKPLSASLDDTPEAATPYLAPPPYDGRGGGDSAAERAVLGAHGLLPWRVAADDVHCMTDEFARGAHHVVDLAVFRHRYSHAGSGRHKRRELFQGTIAVKRLRVDERDDRRARERFLEELAALARAQHPRVTALLGVRCSRALGVQALLEFLEGGSLRAWLAGMHAAGESHAWTPTKAQLALDVAEALAHAHALAPPLVHARLASDKVLLTLDARAKLGHWRAVQPNGQSGLCAAMAAERWLAPELRAASDEHSPASDVFALGVLLAELDTHQLPDEPGELVHHAGGLSVLVEGGRLRPLFSSGRAEGMPRELRTLAQRCLALDPRARVTAQEVARAFRGAVAAASEARPESR